jgi:hypothetical protein
MSFSAENFLVSNDFCSAFFPLQCTVSGISGIEAEFEPSASSIPHIHEDLG